MTASATYKLLEQYWHPSPEGKDPCAACAGGLRADVARDEPPRGGLCAGRAKPSVAMPALDRGIGWLGFWEHDFSTGELVVSDSLCAMLAISRDDLAEGLRSLLELVHPCDRELYRSALAHATPARASFGFEHRMTRSDGTRIAARAHGGVRFDGSGGRVRAFGTIQDITERARLDETMRIYAEAFESAKEAMMILDSRPRIIHVNRAFTTITGYLPCEVEGRCPDFMCSGRQGRASFERIRSTVQRTGQWEGELWERRKNGEIYVMSLSLGTVVSKGREQTTFVGVFSDITARKRAEERLFYYARHDPLTGLLNRRVFMERLDRAVKRCRRAGGKVAVLYVDLDGFKSVNDALGHGAGDTLLAEVARRLRGAVRETDTVARLGGDEFAVALDDVATRELAARVAAKLLRSLRAGGASGMAGRPVRASIGISLFPDDCDDIESLLKNADAAMYVVKGRGKDDFGFFSPARRSAPQRSRAL